MLKTFMLIFDVIMILIIAVAALIGYFKGMKKSLIGLGRTLVAVILTFAVTLILSKLVIPRIFSPEVLDGMLDTEGFLTSLDFLPELAVRLIASIAVPFVFFPVFLIFDLLLLIPGYFIGKALKVYGTDREKVSDTPVWARLTGAGVRGINALIIILLILMPVTCLIIPAVDGITSAVDNALELDISVKTDILIDVPGAGLSDSEGCLDHSAYDDFRRSYVDPIRNDAFLRMSASVPMRALYSGMSGSGSVSNGFRTDLMSWYHISGDAVTLLADSINYGEIQKKAVNNIIGDITGSEEYCRLAAELLSYSGRQILDTGKLFGADMSDLTGSDVSVIFVPVFEVMKNTTADSVKSDLDTLENLFDILVDHGLFGKLFSGEDNDIKDFVEDEAMLELVLNETFRNPDFSYVGTSVINYVFSEAVNGFYGDGSGKDLSVAKDPASLSDAEKAAEAKLLAGIISDIIAILPEGEEDLDLETFGAAADKAMTSLIIGDGMREAMILILESPKFDSYRSLTSVAVEKLRRGENISISNLVSAAKNLTDVLGNMTGEKEYSSDQFADSLKSISVALDDESTASMIREMITEGDLVRETVVSENTSETVVKNVETFLTVFVDELTSGNIPDEQFESEALALDYAVQLIGATTQSDTDVTEAVKKVCGTDEEAREMVEAMVDSQITSSALNAIVYDDQGNMKEDALEIAGKVDDTTKSQLLTACEGFYKDKIDDKPSGDTDNMDSTLKAMASLFGMNIDSDIARWKVEAGKQN